MSDVLSEGTKNHWGIGGKPDYTEEEEYRSEWGMYYNKIHDLRWRIERVQKGFDELKKNRRFYDKRRFPIPDDFEKTLVAVLNKVSCLETVAKEVSEPVRNWRPKRGN